MMATARREPVDQNSSSDRQAIVVVGMHRSGTSAMTRMLALSGAALPKQLMVAQQDNPSGFWEPQSIADLNDEILQALDSEWDDVFAFRPKQYLSNFDRFYLGRAVDLLEQEFNGSQLIVLKDPRISVLTDFWDRALRQAGYAAHYVVMVRNPLEVAESLRIRDEFPREKSLLLWSSYMIAVDRDTRESKRTFVSYDHLMNDWRVVRRRIEKSAGVPFPRATARTSLEIDRFLDRRLRHHQAETEDLFARPDVPDEVKTLYRIYAAACEGAEIDRAAVDAVQAQLEKMDAMVGPLLADLRGKAQKLAKEIADVCEASAAAHDREAALAEELNSERSLRQVEAEAASQQASDLESRAAELHARIDASEADRDRLIKEAEEKRRQISDFDRRLATAEAEHDRLRREVEEKSAQADEMVGRVVASEADRDRLIQELEDQRRQAADLAERLSMQSIEHEHDLEELKARIAAADARSQELAEVYDRDVGQFRTHITELGKRIAAEVAAADAARLSAEEVHNKLSTTSRKLEDAERHLKSQEQDLTATKSSLGDRYRELAELGRAFVEEENLRQRHQQQAQWLRDVNVALMKSEKWWFALMPQSWRRRRRHRQLARTGLFDAQAYLSNYPDVATSGQDPLRHFIVHGIDEDRQL